MPYSGTGAVSRASGSGSSQAGVGCGRERSISGRGRRWPRRVASESAWAKASVWRTVSGPSPASLTRRLQVVGGGAAGVAVVGLAVGVAAGGGLQVDAGRPRPSRWSARPRGAGCPAVYDSGLATTRLTTTDEIRPSFTDSVEVVAYGVGERAVRGLLVGVADDEAVAGENQHGDVPAHLVRRRTSSPGGPGTTRSARRPPRPPPPRPRGPGSSRCARSPCAAPGSSYRSSPWRPSYGGALAAEAPLRTGRNVSTRAVSAGRGRRGRAAARAARRRRGRSDRAGRRRPAPG